MVLACRNASERCSVLNVNHSSESIRDRSSYQMQTINNLSILPPLLMQQRLLSKVQTFTKPFDITVYNGHHQMFAALIINPLQN